MSESLIFSFLVSDASEWIAQVAHQIWTMWANRSSHSPASRSGRSEEMSDCEWIPQVAHQKWAKEWIAHFFEQIALSLIFGQKTSDSLGKPMIAFPAL